MSNKTSKRMTRIEAIHAAFNADLDYMEMCRAEALKREYYGSVLNYEQRIDTLKMTWATLRDTEPSTELLVEYMAPLKIWKGE